MIAPIAALGVAGLALLRRSDKRDDQAEWARLAALQPRTPKRFKASMLRGLPEPARRFFAFAITEGTLLFPVVTLEMTGSFAMGRKDAPHEKPMRARQILAAPHGFVWQMETSGALGLSGSDSGRWTRFWMAGLVPVGRFGDNKDHRHAAFGRYVAESLFWAPAALLPAVAGEAVRWAKVDDATAEVCITHDGLEQRVEIEVDADGQPRLVRFQRWTDANPAKHYRYQPFGGYLSDFQSHQGYQLPMHVEAGNHFETPDYFPFFRADISRISFPIPG